MGQNQSKTDIQMNLISKIFQFPSRSFQGDENSFLYNYSIYGHQTFSAFMNQLILRRKHIYENKKIKQYVPQISVIYTKKSQQTFTCHSQPIYNTFVTQKFPSSTPLTEYFSKQGISYEIILKILKILIQVMNEYQKKKIRYFTVTLNEIYLQNHQNFIIRDSYIRSWNKVQRQKGDHYKQNVYNFGKQLQQFLKNIDSTMTQKETECKKLLASIISQMTNTDENMNWKQLRRLINSENIIKVLNKRDPIIIEQQKRNLTTPSTSYSPQHRQYFTERKVIINEYSEDADIDYRNFFKIGRKWRRFEGYMRNGKKQGYGKIYFSNGNLFEGTFKDDIVNGDGTIYNAEGQIVLMGKWANNHLISQF